MSLPAPPTTQIEVTIDRSGRKVLGRGTMECSVSTQISGDYDSDWKRRSVLRASAEEKSWNEQEAKRKVNKRRAKAKRKSETTSTTGSKSEIWSPIAALYESITVKTIEHCRPGKNSTLSPCDSAKLEEIIYYG